VSVLRPAAFLFLSCALSAKAGEARAKPEQPAMSSNSGYELRGFFGAGENREVSLRKSGSDTSRWCKVGVKSGDLLVESADAKTGTATLVVRGVRHRLRLAGEAPTEPLKVETPLIIEAEKKLSKVEARRERRKRMDAMKDNLTPEQEAVMNKIMREKMSALEKEHPEFSKGPPNTAEAREKVASLFVPVIHEALDAAYKLPGKDGKVATLPTDLDAMMTEEINDAHGEPDAPPAEINATK
jgi:hypothetical protein